MKNDALKKHNDFKDFCKAVPKRFSETMREGWRVLSTCALAVLFALMEWSGMWERAR